MIRLRWWLFAGITFFIIAISLFALARSWLNPIDEKRERAVQGIMTLTETLEGHRIIPLIGEWRFFPDEYKMPEEVDWRSESVNSVHIPGNGWDRMLGRPTGVGTYALEVQLHEPMRMLALKTAIIRMAHRLYVNGELVGTDGQLSDTGAYSSRNLPYTTYIPLQGERIQIIVQVENQTYGRAAGMLSPPVLGSPSAVEHYQKQVFGYDLIRAVSYGLGGLLFFCFYWMWRSRRYPLYLSLHLITIAIFVATHGEKILGASLSSISFYLFYYVQILALLLSPPFIALYSHKLFPSRTGAMIVKGLSAFSVIAVLFALVLPPPLFTRIDLVYGVPVFIGYFFSAFLFAQAAWQRKDGALLCLLSSLHLIVLYIESAGTLNGLLSTHAVPPWDAVSFMLVQFLLIGRRFANMSRATELLSMKIIEVSEAKDRFIQQNAYRLQEPLYKVEHLLSLVLEKPERRVTDQVGRLRMARMLLHQQLDQVQDLVNLTKLQEGRSTELSPMLVKECIENVFRHMSGLPECDGVTFSERIPLEFHLAQGEETIFRQVLRKLIIASVRPGSRVYADGVIVQPDNVQISLFISHSALSAEEAGEMMGLELDQKESFHSRAMHLIMAYQWTLQLGGQLRVEGQDDIVYRLTLQSVQGASDLPAAAALHEAAAALQAVETAQVIGRTNTLPGKVMIVASDAILREIMHAILMEAGYELIAVDSASSAIHRLSIESLPDLVICDQLIHGMSGVQLCVELRRAYSSAALPFLLIVSPLEAEERLLAFQAEVNDIVVNPFEASELRGRVSNLVSMKQSMEAAARMEQAFLQAQIKPHFLYNAMNVILSLSYTDVTRARQAILDLSSYLRLSFDFGNTQQLVPLSQEIELVEVYLNIESVRYGSRLRYEITWDRAIEASIPPLTLQPIVENAVRHGIAPTPLGGEVYLNIERQHDQIIAVITDTGIGMDEQRLQAVNGTSRLEGHVGIYNIRRRLHRLTGASMRLESSPNIGTKVTLCLPYESKEKSEAQRRSHNE